jgi:hypothetical protein
LQNDRLAAKLKQSGGDNHNYAVVFWHNLHPSLV